jgi:hypothetical protein
MKLFPRLRSGKVAPVGQPLMPKLELQMPNPNKSEITNYLKFFMTETRTLTPETFCFLQHIVRKILLRA